jgi:hypothetical protein
MKRRDACPGLGTAENREVTPRPSPLHKLGYLLHFSLSSAGFVTALSDRFQSGGRFPASSFIASILPGLLVLDGPVKCPLYARAIDIFGAAPVWRSDSSLPSSCKLLVRTPCSHNRLYPQTPANSQTGAYEHSLPSPAPGT